MEAPKIKYKHGKIFSKLIAIMSEIGPIKKEKEGAGIRYKFRGIDQVYETLQPLLAKHGVIVLPTETRQLTYEEMETKAGSALNYCRLIQVYTFFSGEDDSWVECEMPGEAMDTSDKATNKALSAAFKYLAFQSFCIPTDDPDLDSETSHHERRPRSERAPSYPTYPTPPKQQAPQAPPQQLKVEEPLSQEDWDRLYVHADEHGYHPDDVRAHMERVHKSSGSWQLAYKNSMAKFGVKKDG